MKYRPDIDGLRSIAVLSIIVFHFKIPGLEGGYVGVDVFYVISGYLIGSIILNDIKNNTFSFVTFYRRRIARLYPAYVVMMCFTTLAAFWLFLPREFREFGKSIVASVFYASNILFFRESGYFDTSASLKPLLHTWSLSIEEQFYLLFPGFAYLAFRYVRKAGILILVTVVCILSLLLSAHQIGNDRNAVFYLFPFRAWELLLGVMIATGKLPPVDSPLAANVLAWLGLGSIAVAVGTYTGRTVFPGLAALLPCLGAFFIIHSGSRHQPMVNRLLSRRAPVFVGLISYSLYLWHWPLVIFAEYYLLRNLTYLETAALIALTFVLATISWRYVEHPFRLPTNVFRRGAASLFTAAALASVVLAGAGFVIYRTNGLPSRLSPETARVAEAAGDFMQDWNGCVDKDNPFYPGLAHCVVGDAYDAEAIFLAWGDSHVGAFRKGLEAAAKENGKSGLLVLAGGCPPLFGIEKDETASTAALDRECTTQNELVRRLLESSNKLKSVILMGRWSYYAEGAGVGIDQDNKMKLRRQDAGRTSNEDQKFIFAQAFLETVKRLRELGTSVYIVQQVPEIPLYNSQRLGASLRRGSVTYEAALTDLVLVDYGDVSRRQEAASRAIDRACALYGAKLLKTHSFFCREGRCSAMLDGLPAYFDNNHITGKTSTKIGALFSPAMRPSTN